MELANGLLYGFVALFHGLDLRSAGEMAFLTAVLILGLIDLDHRILPDVITLPGVAAAWLLSFAAPPPRALESAASAVGMYLLFAAIAVGYEKLRGLEGLGQGDWKMAAMMGAFLGWQQALFAVFAGALLGSIIGMLMMGFARKDSRYALPFGTFLALGGAAAVFVGEPLVDWYRSLIAG